MSSWRFGPRTCGAAAVSVLAFAGALSWLGGGLAAQQSPGKYKGRDIAHVMSFRGAAWLERETRVEEEDPEAMLALLPLEKGDRAVDMGCGSGYYARRLAQRVGPEGKVYCVDIQPEMLEIAKQLAEREGLDNIEYVLGTVDDPRLPEGVIDLIVLVDVYHEFAQPEPMLAAMRTALAPDGVAALAEYRLEGRTAAWIKVDHRMSIDQVMKEWVPAGFELEKRHDSLKSQHLFLFSRDEP